MCMSGWYVVILIECIVKEYHECRFTVTTMRKSALILDFLSFSREQSKSVVHCMNEQEKSIKSIKNDGNQWKLTLTISLVINFHWFPIFNYCYYIDWYWLHRLFVSIDWAQQGVSTWLVVNYLGWKQRTVLVSPSLSFLVLRNQRQNYKGCQILWVSWEDITRTCTSRN